MSVRRLGKHTLPENPTWLEFTTTDGDKAQWPRNTTKVVDGDGQVNYMRPVTIDEDPAVHWRIVVGAALAKALGKPDGPTYVLKTWPKGYAMYDHNKGKQSNPRHDMYLYGSIHIGKFRSANEFVPHATWLLTDPTLTRSNCACKYCTKMPQKVISQSLGLSTHTGGKSSPAPSAIRSGKRDRNAQKPSPRNTTPVKKKPYTAVRRMLRTPKRLPGPKQFVVPERANDVQQSVRKSDVFAPRFFRSEELVWCSIQHPIPSTSGLPKATIKLWPGIIEETSLKTSSSVIDPSLTNGETQELAVQQWTVYKTKLLGSNQRISITDKEALPYLAYAPPEEVLQGVRDELHHLVTEFPVEEMGQDQLGRLYEFDPTNEALVNDPSRYRKAVFSYTLGIQIASHIAQYWTPTDEWDYKFTIPPTIVQQTPTSQQPQSLHDMISATMASNAQNKTTPVPPPRFTGDSGLSPDELRSVRSDLLGASVMGMSSIPRTVTQTRYQGLWWGAERIWQDELVRLKMARSQFAPNGAPQVYPPSKASASFLEAHGPTPEYPDPRDPEHFSAGNRGLFMKLDGIFVVDTQTEDGSILKECRANGMLYELADEGWEEPSHTEPIRDAKGKGKERAHDVGMGFLNAQGLVAGSQPSVAPDGQTGPSFMQGPSPLRPQPLPNPDPAVPTSATAANALSQTMDIDVSQPSPTESKDRAQISRPILAGITALPPAPRGYKFRPIVPEGHEVVLSVSLISGRYYPGLFEHPLLDNILEKSFNNPEVPLFENRHLWALEGIMPGAFQSMDPSEWRPTRGSMLFDSIADSKRHFSDRWGEMQKTRMELEKQLLLAQDDPDGEGEMEVDELFEESASMAGS